MERKALITLTGILSILIAGFAYAPAAQAQDWHDHEIRHDIRFARHELIGNECHPGIVQTVLNII